MPGTFGGAQEDALSPLYALGFPLTAGSTDPNQSLPIRLTFDQPTVEEMLKDEIRASQGWQSAHTAGYDGLLPGIPLVPNILFQLIDKMFDASPLGDVFDMDDIQEFLNNPTFMTFLDAVIPDLHASKITDGTFPMEMIEGLVDELLGFLNIDSPLNAENLFNLLPGHVIGNISISTIGDFFANLINNPLFENLDSINSTVYSWDSTQYHALPGGSAKVFADGSGSKDLLSNLIPVSEGQPLHMSSWVKWSGLAGTGTPIRMGLTNYLNGSAVGQPDIQTYGVVPATTDWLNLQGDYTIPANVDAVRLRLTVAPSASAGTVWWDDTHLSKRGLLPQPLIRGIIGDTLLDDLEDARANILSNTNDIIERALNSDLVNLMQALDPTGTLEAIETRIDSFLDSLSVVNAEQIGGIGTIGDQFLPGVLTTVDNIFTRLFNISGSGFTHDQSASALFHVSDVLAGLTSKVVDLQARITTGLNGGDDFERSASSLGANWNVVYFGSGGGSIRTDGHNANWSKSGTSKRGYRAVYQPLVCNSNFQQWGISLNSRAENPLLNIFGSGQPAYNSVLGRCSADGLNCIEFRIGDGDAWIIRILSGVESVLFHSSYSGSDPGPGSGLTLICGFDGNERYYIGRHNGNAVVQGDEGVGGASLIGGAYRRGGMGGIANPWLNLLTQSAPGEVRQWAGGDQ